MTYRLPKDRRTLVFSELTGFELNDFDVERLLPALFDVVASSGRERLLPKADLENHEQYVDQLAAHPMLENFDTVAGRRALRVLVYSGIASVATKSRRRNLTQLDYVLPLSIMSFRSGLPKVRSRHRRVQWVLYDAMRRRLSAAGVEQERALIKDLFWSAFGRGVKALDAAQKFDARYDESTPMDLMVLASARYLEAFEPPELKAASTVGETHLALPGAEARLADDLIAYLAAYQDLPEQALARHLAALVNFELFAYSMRLFDAVIRAVRDGESPIELLDSDSPTRTELYTDFTRERGGPSDDLARLAVNRDLEKVRRYFEASILLRETETLARYQPNIGEDLPSLSINERIGALLRLAGMPELQIAASADLGRLEEVVRTELGDDAADELRQDIEAVPGEPLSKLASVIANQPGSRGVENAVKWFWSTGGLRQPFGLLRGNLRGPRNWRYAMTDELLTTLVQVSLLSYEPGQPHLAQRRARQPLPELLAFLEDRYGVVVGRPPEGISSVESRGASEENLAAFKLRLRQLGYFDALSDDFNAQYVVDRQVASA